MFVILVLVACYLLMVSPVMLVAWLILKSQEGDK